MKLPGIIWLIFLFTIVSHLFFIRGAAVFDEPGYLEGVYNTYNNHLNPFVEFNGYKPPMTVWIPAVASTFFGLTRVWARVWIIIFSCIALLYTYRLAKIVFDDRVAMLSTTLFCFFPLFFVQGYIVSDAILMTAGILSLLYYVMEDRWIGVLASATFLVLTKETAIIGLVGVGIYYLRFNRKSLISKRIVALVVPLMVFIGWLVWNKQVLGWYMWPSNWMKLFLTSPFQLGLVNIWEDIQVVFTQPYVFIMSAFVLVGMTMRSAAGTQKRPIPWRPLLLFIFLGGTYFFFYHYIGLEVRYILFFYPLLIMTFSYVVLNGIVKQSMRHIIIGCVFVFYGLWYVYATFLSTQYHPERSFDLFVYRNLVDESVRYIHEYNKEAIVVSNWPMLEVWRDPFRAGPINESIACATKEKDHDGFRAIFQRQGRELLYVQSPGIGPFDCDFADIDKQLIREIRTTYPFSFKDVIHIYRLTPSSGI